jgi:hypothetical protein
LDDFQKYGVEVDETIQRREYFMVIYAKLLKPKHSGDELTQLLRQSYELVSTNIGYLLKALQIIFDLKECAFASTLDPTVWFDLKRTILTQVGELLTNI